MPNFDPSRKLLLSTLARYFRLELAGRTDAIPDWGVRPCLFVMNHTALVGLEVYLLYAALERLRPGAPRVLTTVWPPFLDVPLLGAWYRSGGCVPASVAGAVDALRNEESVLFLPEGPDATDVRDEIGPFHSGFLRVIQEMQVPIVPFGWCGVDEANPWWVTTNPLLVKLLMKPAMPRFDFALIPRLPLLRPSKVVMVAGEPIELSAADLDTEAKLRDRVDHVRNTVIELVDTAKRLRSRRIQETRRERVLHVAFRMRRPLWRRR